MTLLSKSDLSRASLWYRSFPSNVDVVTGLARTSTICSRVMSKTLAKGHVYIATSLDGFVARKDHRIDWLLKQDTEGEDYGMESFMASVDGLVMGRGSYQNVLTFGKWPYKKPTIVMSKTLRSSDLPTELKGQVELTQLEPEPLMFSLHRRGWKNVYVDGGKVVQSFFRAGLIEDLNLTRVPMLIGSGLSLFGELDDDLDLKHLGTQSFPSGLVQSRYRVLNPAKD